MHVGKILFASAKENIKESKWLANFYFSLTLLLPDIFVVKVDFLPFKFKFTESSNSYISPPSKVNFMCCFLKRIMNNSSSVFFESSIFTFLSLHTLVLLSRPLQKAKSYGSYFLIRSLSWRHNAYISLSLKILWESFFRSSQGHGRRPKRKL